MKPIRALLLLLLVFQPLNPQFNHPLITTAHASSLLNDSMQAPYNGSLTTTNASDNHLPNPLCSPGPGENEHIIPSLVVGSYSLLQLNPAAVPMGVSVNQTAPGNSSTNPSSLEDNVHGHGNSSKIKVDGNGEAAIKVDQYQKEAMAVQEAADVSTINGKLAGSTPPPGQTSPITTAAIKVGQCQEEADVSTINGKLAGSTPPPGQSSPITTAAIKAGQYQKEAMQAMAVQEADVSTINGQLRSSTPPPGQPPSIHTAAGASIARVQPPPVSTTTTISSPSSSLQHGDHHDHDHDDHSSTTTNVHEDVETS